MGCNNDFCDIDAEDTFEAIPARQFKEYRIITESLPREERLAQLAEECAELSQAALKLRRALTGGNPTTTAETEAEHCMAEEIADVLTCLIVAGDYITSVTAHDYIEAIRQYKQTRWARRIIDAGNAQSHD